jgi:ribosomal protein S12 methylthiotransferase accessory factor
MEGIELACAEYDESVSPRHVVPARSVVRSIRCASFVDLCPTVGTTVAADEPITCVSGVELRSGREVSVPAELVFIPFTRMFAGCRPLFGTSTNGLGAGGSLREARVHALCELIERDVQSRDLFHDCSQCVLVPSLPEAIGGLVNSISSSRCTVIVRTTPNVFALPYFRVFILDRSDSSVPVAVGSAVHPDPEIAVLKAIAEAIQARALVMHGLRDANEQHYSAAGRVSLRSFSDHLLANSQPAVLFPHVGAPIKATESLADIEESLYVALSAQGLSTIVEVDLSRDSSLRVVRIIVPGLEYYDPVCRRVGPRLVQAAMNAAAG